MYNNSENIKSTKDTFFLNAFIYSGLPFFDFAPILSLEGHVICVCVSSMT